MTKLRWILLGAVAAFLLAGCGKAVLVQSKSEQLVQQFVYAHFQLHVKATCPSGVPAKVGQTYTCYFQGPNGKYEADLTVTGVKGSAVQNRIATHGPIN